MGVTIYKDTEKLEDKVFKNPPAEYRGTPFWAWNGDLKKELLSEQIDAFKKMGLGGAHLHVRTGLVQEYLGKEHMDCIAHCTKKFKKEKMLSWLYDEDRWPSGAAGGYVTKDLSHRIKYLIFTVNTRPLDGHNTLLACYDVELDENGFLAAYRRVTEDEKNICGTLWRAYMAIPRSDSWFNGQSYVDTMSREAIKKFIDITYTAYEKTVGNEFGKTVPAMFTDEPNMGYKKILAFSDAKTDITFSITKDFAKEYIKNYGYDLFDHLPELFWELPDGKVSPHRYRYHDLACEMFTSAFCDQCGAWCEKHGILFTGHMLHEETLGSQTDCVGEAMRNYRSFGLPGIDMLCNYHEYTTAKQCQSAVHQYGRPGMLSELYGVTNWDHDFRGHKHQGDWQAALGVTTRVQHLAYYSMEGEAKRDYPASIGYQSPWYEKYNYIEDHFARVNTAMTRGKADVKVGVIHPIESYWLHYGPKDKTSEICTQMENNFQNLIQWLLFGTVDFDYICESTLPTLCKKGTAPFKVGKMAYDVIIVPACETLRSTTLSRLEEFCNAGGKLIFMGNAPTLCDALPSERGKELYERATHIFFGKTDILSQLDAYRDISIICTNGVPTSNLIYQLRREKNGTKWLFIAHGKDYTNVDIPTYQDTVITIKGKFTPTLYDTLTGKISPVPFCIKNGNTVIDRRFHNHDSLLLRLDKYTAQSEKAAGKDTAYICDVKFPSVADYTLSERNVYVLDMADYKLNDGEWQGEEEMLRLDTACRKALGWPQMGGRMVQPWLTPEPEITNFVTLRYNINSEIEVKEPFLAVEKADKVKVFLNGKEVISSPCGYYVDRHIARLPLPSIPAGANTLELVCPIGQRTAVENAYLLGDFGVKVVGREKTIIPLPEKLAFDDIRYQGLPFYSANVTYKCVVKTDKNGILCIHAPAWRGALISVKVDGKECGNIAFSPYDVNVKTSAGEHIVELTLYGTRFNTFGQLHCHHNEGFKWYGPTSFRTEGDQWSYEYETKPAGILRTPVCSLKK
ncbi:MAG: hypothetical protein IKV97_03680 [Clostridia bacterium]|nr:hypothetical protein [Clostridia bacterium]